MLEVLTGIKEAITRLNRIGVAIRCSSRSTITARARRFASQYPDLIQLPEFEDRAYLALHYLYPHSPETLRQQILDSMTDRYAKLRYEAFRTRAKHASETAAPEAEPDNKNNSTDSTAERSTNDHLSDASKEDVGEAQGGQRTAHFRFPASSIDTARLPVNLDRAILPTVHQASAPKTLIGPSGRPQDPDVPKFEDGQEYTYCEWCHQLIDRSLLHGSRNEWSEEGRRHYRRDLQPYFCLAEDCREARPSFASSGEWFTHIQSDHSDSTIHNQPAWTCTAEHENDTSYTFSSKDELIHHVQVQHCHDMGGANESDLEQSGYLAQSVRQAHLCPLCLFSLEETPPEEQATTNNVGTEKTVVTWAMALHIAKHLHQLMIVSLRIMSSMQSSEDKAEGYISSQYNASTMSVSADGEAVKRRLKDLPESVQGSLDWPESQEDAPSITDILAPPQHCVENQPPKDNRLRLLSLGGIEGVSGSYMLQYLKLVMDGVNSLRHTRHLPRAAPCEVFDLIGGTGTGG
jgi:hypothetical protein